jgi:hypothetical protein
MRQMPYGQWLAFNADDTIHKCDGSSGYDNTSSNVSHGLQPPTPPIIAKPAAFRPVASQVAQNRKTRTPPVLKKGFPGWVEALISWIIILLLVYLFAKK